MVDREYRNKLCEAIGQYMSSCFDNNELVRIVEESVNEHSGDVAIWALRCHLITQWEDPFKKYYFDDLNVEQQTLLKRCQLFLQSDLEYHWPPIPKRFEILVRSLRRMFLRFMPMTTRIQSGYEVQVDESVWPFSSNEEYEALAVVVLEDSSSRSCPS